MKRQSIFEALPTEIIHEITSRMSFKSIMNCKLVCKMWLTLISQPHFTKLHLSRIIAKSTALDYDNVIHFGYYWTRNRILRSVNENDVLTFDITNLHPLSDLNFSINIAGSCNGLICFVSNSIDHYCNNGVQIETPYLYNPVLGQCVALPKPNPCTYEMPSRVCTSDYKLGFCPNTNEYKLVRIVTKISDTRRNINCEQLCEILSVGNSQHEWRSLGKPPKIRACALPKMCTTVFLYSSIHWLIRDEQTIVSFNIENETFGSFLMPLIPFPYNHVLQLGVLDNCLACTCKPPYGSDRTEVWIMEDYKVRKSWIKKWSLKLSDHSLSPVKVSSDGQIIFLSCDRCENQTLHSYNPKDEKIVPKDGHLVRCFRTLKLFPYTPTFLSPMEVAGTRHND